jgi:rare lipoprotein A
MNALVATLVVSALCTGLPFAMAGQPSGPGESAAVQAPALTPDQVKQAQEALKLEGLYPGAIDGVVGPCTRQALRAYQAREGLPQSGFLDDPTFHRLALRAPCVQDGLAAWSGYAYQGRQTASGERFAAEVPMAAHRTLPFGTQVRVTNLETQQSMEVRITDRGPKTKEHLIDLSQAAAEQIGLRRRGEIRVRVKVLDPTACAA